MGGVGGGGLFLRVLVLCGVKVGVFSFEGACRFGGLQGKPKDNHAMYIYIYIYTYLYICIYI